MNNFEINSNQKIQLLPEHLINQIKAGEVIERPATLLKELLENAIDANANKIQIAIINNGLDLIQVSDNGNGIDYEQLPMAFCRHATSKIEKFEDLYSIYSYGFRGEALASMASVSKLICNTTSSNHFESTIKIEGGLTTGHYQEKSKTQKTGTNIYVKELFYNTPARLKFIKSATAEKNQLTKVINAFLLTNPNIDFSIKWDDKDKVHFEKCEQLEQRVKDIFFKKNQINSDLNCINNEYDNIEFKLLYSPLTSKGNNGKKHFIFINNRLVFDKQIHQIILHNLAVSWPQGETGHYCAYIRLPANQIDINVHPNKTIVKFHQSAKVLSLVSSSIKNSFLYLKNQPQVNQLHEDLETREFPESQSPKSTFSYQSIFKRNEDTDTVTTQNQYLYKTTLSMDRNFIIKKNSEVSEYFLINKDALLRSFLKFAFVNKQLDLSPTPLLVSKPIKMSDKNDHKDTISTFESFGIEIERIDPQTLVIRSIPNFLSTLSTDSFIAELFLTAISKKTLTLAIDKLEIDLENFTQSDFEKIIEISPELLKACKILTDFELEKIL